MLKCDCFNLFTIRLSFLLTKFQDARSRSDTRLVFLQSSIGGYTWFAWSWGRKSYKRIRQEGFRIQTLTQPSSGFRHILARSSVDAISFGKVFVGKVPSLLFRLLVSGPKSRTHPDSEEGPFASFPVWSGCAGKSLCARSPFEIPFVKSHCNFDGAKSATY